jgi:hypothetical protein
MVDSVEMIILPANAYQTGGVGQLDGLEMKVLDGNTLAYCGIMSTEFKSRFPW